MFWGPSVQQSSPTESPHKWSSFFQTPSAACRLGAGALLLTLHRSCCGSGAVGTSVLGRLWPCSGRLGPGDQEKQLPSEASSLIPSPILPAPGVGPPSRGARESPPHPRSPLPLGSGYCTGPLICWVLLHLRRPCDLSVPVRGSLGGSLGWSRGPGTLPAVSLWTLWCLGDAPPQLPSAHTGFHPWC